jgi:hypothetical protein
MEVTEVIRCRGHPLVSASHPTTFMITAEKEMTANGHCIVGVGADRGAAGLSPEFRQALCRDRAELITTLSCGNETARIHSAGCAGMTLTQDRKSVV